MNKPLISEDYRKMNQWLFQNSEGYGTSGHKHASMVRDLIRSKPCIATILDYGCGRQTLQAALLEHVINGYDPAIPGLDAAPKPHDLVICGDVLEHIEPEFLTAVLENLRYCTKKCGYFVIHTGPAKKNLPDGRNAHLIQEDERFWLPKLLDVGFHIELFRKTASHLILVVN